MKFTEAFIAHVAVADKRKPVVGDPGSFDKYWNSPSSYPMALLGAYTV